jgi:hypothetical protein
LPPFRSGANPADVTSAPMRLIATAAGTLGEEARRTFARRLVGPG